MFLPRLLALRDKETFHSEAPFVTISFSVTNDPGSFSVCAPAEGTNVLFEPGCCPDLIGLQLSTARTSAVQHTFCENWAAVRVASVAFSCAFSALNASFSSLVFTASLDTQVRQMGGTIYFGRYALFQEDVLLWEGGYDLLWEGGTSYSRGYDY